MHSRDGVPALPDCRGVRGESYKSVNVTNEHIIHIAVGRTPPPLTQVFSVRDKTTLFDETLWPTLGLSRVRWPARASQHLRYGHVFETRGKE